MKIFLIIILLLLIASCGGDNGPLGCTDCDDLIANMLKENGDPDEIEYFTVDNSIPRRQWSANYFYFDQGFYVQYIQYNCGCSEQEYDF